MAYKHSPSVPSKPQIQPVSDTAVGVCLFLHLLTAMDFPNNRLQEKDCLSTKIWSWHETCLNIKLTLEHSVPLNSLFTSLYSFSLSKKRDACTTNGLGGHFAGLQINLNICVCVPVRVCLQFLTCI